MAPSITIGATILLCRKPATKVIVFQSPSGTRPINRMPRGAGPLRRTRLVLTAVSSINTRRAGSNMPCSRIQRRRARTTSARSCSAARRLFFEGDVVSIEKPPKRTAAGSNSLFAQLGQGLFQGQIRLLGNQSQYPLRKLFQWRNTSATRLWRRAPDLPPALQPSDRRTRTDLETLCRFAPRSPPPLRAAKAPFPQPRSLAHASPQNKISASSCPIKENQCPHIRSHITSWESARFKSGEKRSSAVDLKFLIM